MDIHGLNGECIYECKRHPDAGVLSLLSFMFLLECILTLRGIVLHK